MPPRPAALFCCLLWIITGCAPLPEVTEVRQVKVPVRVDVPVPMMDPVDQANRHAMRYAERVRGLPLPELQQEIVRLNESPVTPKSTLELAFALGQTRAPGDLQKAVGLLEGLLRSTEPEAAPWQPMARMTLARFLEMRRLEEQLDKQNQQLRDSQRRIDQLNEKLEALKAIERSLAPRPVPAAPASAPVPGTRPTPP
ncbi:hypothetical protein M8A51_20920 [Schlegelella sp. S2-27]|uniref:YfhG lipoprotein n=1 Tax=Caldimonas mangrovi TaxID=2944811 RepID=A0ABT0YTC1_9BURK|nr:hypothetical protein [Caldimonas mangrovi]MCM5681998.1 hypothetical protein [Caldimonas mangrovi]